MVYAVFLVVAARLHRPPRLQRLPLYLPRHRCRVLANPLGPQALHPLCLNLDLLPEIFYRRP